MTVPVSKHPTLMELEQYALGHMEQAEATAVKGHLAECPQCQEALAKVTPHAQVIAARLPAGAWLDGSQQIEPGDTRRMSEQPAPSSNDTPPPVADYRTVVFS